jgi:signal transduction histidine kinase
MKSSLAGWLTDNRDTLLPRWIALLEEAPHAANGNGLAAASQSTAATGAASESVAHPGEQQVLLTSIYEGLISAASGDRGPLDDCLRLLRALRTHPGEDELPQQLVLAYKLRRVAWEVLFGERRGAGAKGRQPDNPPITAVQRRLMDEFEDLLEYTTVGIATQWAGSAKGVARELDETRLLVETLYHDAEAADRTTLQVSRLNEIAEGLSASLNQPQQMAIVGEKLKSTLAVPSLTIWLLDKESSCLYAMRNWSDSPVPDASHWRIVIDDERDIVARAFGLGDLVVEPAPDADAQGAWYQPPCAVLAVPLIAQSHPIGVIVVQHPDAHLLLDRTQHDFVKSAAGQAAIAFENARLYEEVRGFNAVLEQRIDERTHELQVERDMLGTLYDVALEVSSTLDLGLLLENSLRALAKLVGVNQGSIMLVEQDTEHLVHRAVLGQRGDVGVTRFPMGQGIVGWVAQNRKPALVPDVSTDPRWVQLPDEETQRKNTGSMIAVPLIAQHDTLGVLLLSHDEVGYFNDGHLRLLNASAGEIALGIHNALLFDQIERQLLHQGEMRRRQEEENSQSTAILQSLSDGVIVCNADGVVLAANPAVERILERPIEELVIWNLPELLKRLLGNRASDVPVDDLLQRPVNERHEPRTFTSTFQIGPRVINMTLGPVLMSNGRLMGAVAVFRDITREVESDRLKTEFIGTVSHELRTPMTSIKGFTQLLAMGSLGPINDTQREFLNTIQTNAERMILIINDLLDITKIETGTVDLDFRPVHLAENLSNVVSELRPSIAGREHELTINIPPGLPLLRADAKRLNQILHNLLSNAVKYTPRGGKITIEARECGADVVPEAQRDGLKPGARYVLIDITDSGVGIAPEEQQRIFERFYRTENPLKIEAGGTGLGLSLVRPLTALLGGRMWVASDVGEGSTFSMIIPVNT